MARFAIVLQAVLEDEVHIVEEVLKLEVLIRVQLALHSTEVHWLLDDVEVVWDRKFLWVNRLMENPSILVLPKVVEHSLGGLIPAVIYSSLVAYLGHLEGIYGGWCFFLFLSWDEILGKFWVLLDKLGPLLVAERLVLTISKHCKLITFGNLSFIDLLFLRLDLLSCDCGCCLRWLLTMLSFWLAVFIVRDGIVLPH